ncbi:MAG TPA: sensor histidine kinase [Streptosporangiaceae bacterium]|nr:sensor histidine kinase [Streptosporangiaceae bacterium]
MRFRLRWSVRTADWVLAVTLGVLMVSMALLAGAGVTVRPLGYALLLAGALALAARHRAPVTVLAVTTGCVLCYPLGMSAGTVTTFPLAAIGAFPALIAVYTAARAGWRWPAVAAGLLLVLGVFGISLLDHGGELRQVVQSCLSLAGWLVAAGAYGVVTRQHGVLLRQAEQRAAEAERTQEETAIRRAGEERLRIARDLHDSLTHTISVIKVHAGVAVHLARKRGEDVPDALLAIQDASRTAMRELRATLDVLRQPGDRQPDALGQLPGLLDMVSSVGVKATLLVSGQRRALPAEVGQAAYRIVQEALTNVTRHAGKASATVRVSYGPAELTVQIDDDGLARPGVPAVPGTGLTGMRERVTALGGELSAGPRAAGGFSVLARLPLAVRERPADRDLTGARPAGAA